MAIRGDSIPANFASTRTAWKQAYRSYVTTNCDEAMPLSAAQLLALENSKHDLTIIFVIANFCFKERGQSADEYDTECDFRGNFQNQHCEEGCAKNA